MARIMRSKDGQYVAIKDDGSRVPVNPSTVEKSEIFRPPTQSADVAAPQPAQPASDPFIVRNEQGVDVGTRALVKNWAASPEIAKSQLESMGYDVRPYGNHPMKMQFAVRPRGKTGVWKVLDPDGFDWQDVLDLGGDALAGGVQALSMMSGGGAAKQALTGAVGGSLGEAARQSIGELSGIPHNTSGANIATAGAVGGAIPVLAKAAAPIIKPIGSALAYGFERFGTGLRYAAARFAGVRDLPNMPLTEALSILRNNAGRKVVPIADQAKALHRVMMDPQSGLLNETWPEVAQVNEALVRAKQAGASMDFSPVIDNLERLGQSKEAGMVERRAPDRAESKFDALFKDVRENPEANPSAPEEPRVAAAASKRDATFMAENNRRVAERRQFADLTPPEKESAMAGARAKEVSDLRAKYTPSELSDPQFKDLHPDAARAMEDAGRTQRIGAPEGTERRANVDRRIPPVEAPAPPQLPSSSAKQVTELLNFLTERVNRAGVKFSEVPLDLAHQLKRAVQDLARKGGAYAGDTVAEPFARVGRDAAATIRQGIIDAMPDELKNDFTNAMGSFERKSKLRTAIINSFRTPSDVESFLRDVHGKSNAAAALHLSGLENEFGVSIAPELEQARASEMVNRGGATDLIRRHPYAAGAAIFHPGAGAALFGGMMGAPAAGKALEAVSRGVSAGSSLLGAGARRLSNSPEAMATAVRLIQEAAANKGKGIASESQASVSRTSGKKVTRLF
jgi:hypothetical protein